MTMRSPGTASILIRAEGTDEAWDNAVIVQGGEAWTGSWGDYDPEDCNETLNIYKSPDTGSKVIAVRKRWDSTVIRTKGTWVMVDVDGYVGYVAGKYLAYR